MKPAPQMQTPGGNLASAEENTENTASMAPDGADGKRFRNAQARAALARHVLRATEDGYWLLRVGGIHSRHCRDLDTVETLLDRMGAPR